MSHKTKSLVVSFGQHVLWRLPHKKSGAGKFDSEWNDGNFFCLAGTSSEAYTGTPEGVVKANDYRLVSDSPYSVDDLTNFKTSMREYVEGDSDVNGIIFPQTGCTRSGAHGGSTYAIESRRLQAARQHQGLPRLCADPGRLDGLCKA